MYEAGVWRYIDIFCLFKPNLLVLKSAKYSRRYVMMLADWENFFSLVFGCAWHWGVVTGGLFWEDEFWPSFFYKRKIVTVTGGNEAGVDLFDTTLSALFCEWCRSYVN